MVEETIRDMMEANRKYKEDFGMQVLPSRTIIEPRTLVFVRKEFYGLYDQRCKLAPITKGLSSVVLTTHTNFVEQMDGKEERLSQDRVVLAPARDELLCKEILQEVGSDITLKHTTEAESVTTVLDEEKGMSSTGWRTTRTRTGSACLV